MGNRFNNKTGDVFTKQEKWLKLLIGNNDIEEFNQIRASSRTDLFAICKYKKILRQHSNRGCVDFIEIEKHYINDDIKSLHTLINELFLEYYTNEEFSEFLNLMKETSTSIKEVYDRHMESPEDTIFSHLTL